MKEFLEKRWWQGIGGIAGVMALVLVILQFRGIVHISALTVSIAVNIILAIALALVAVRAISWKHKYEAASNRLKEKKETLKRQRVLLPDPNNVGQLNIDNAFLNERYGQAYARAVNKYHDAKLSSFAISVNPHWDDKVSLHFDFYSQWARRECTFIISEIGDMRESLPDRPKVAGATFDELPWIRDPSWPQTFKKSCEKVGPLSPARWTNYMFWAKAGEGSPWTISFEDGVTGEESYLHWGGEGKPIERCEDG